MQFRIGSLMLAVATFALAVGWFVDHARQQTTISELAAEIELQQTDIRYGVGAVARATTHWLLLDRIDNDSSDPQVRELIIHELMDNLYSLSANESGINAMDKVPADYWASKILTSLGCKSSSEFREMVDAKNHRFDHRAALPHFYDPNSAEYRRFDEFIQYSIETAIELGELD